MATGAPAPSTSQAGYLGSNLKATHASPTWALPTKACHSEHEHPCSSHQDICPAEVKSTGMSKTGMKEAKEKHIQTLPTKCLERLLLDNPHSRNTPSSGVPLSKGAKFLHFPHGICNHKSKPNDAAEQGNHFRAYGVGKGRDGQRELSRQSSKYFITKYSTGLVECFPMFSNTYTAEWSTAKYLAVAHMNLRTSIIIFISLELQTKPVTGSGMERWTVTVAARLLTAEQWHRFLQGLKSISMADNPPKAGTQIRTEMRQSGEKTTLDNPLVSSHYFLFLGFSSSAALRRKM